MASADAQGDCWELTITAIGKEIDEIPSGDSVYIGIAASDFDLPHPTSPSGSMVYMFLSGELLVDHREAGAIREVWDLTIEIGGYADANLAGFLAMLEWDPNAIGPASKIEMRRGNQYGGRVVYDMREVGSYRTLPADAQGYDPNDNEAVIRFSIIFEPVIWYRDEDGDGCGDPNDKFVGSKQPSGYVAEACDCDDTDPNTYAGAPEVCDGKDNNCDGVVPATEIDNDGDGMWGCEGDCDDTDPNIYTGAPEICDGKDNDCDGLVPDDEQDTDGDGYRICGGDCDDADPNRYAGAPELCDGNDNDCDGVVPDNEEDTDGDGCRICGGDCDDSDPNTYTGATEKSDGKDNDCDGYIDEGFDSDKDYMDDAWEYILIEADPGDGIDATEAVLPSDDFDNDGLTNLEEYQRGTDPIDPDTDSDAIPDGWEVDRNLDPLDEADADDDPDEDDFTNIEEYKGGTDPRDGLDHPTRPYAVEQDCHPYPGQGITSTPVRIPNDTSVVIRIKDDTGIDTNSIDVRVDTNRVLSLFKKVKGDNRDYWIIYRPMNEFGYDQTVHVAVNSANVLGIFMKYAFTYRFKVESKAEHDAARENAPNTPPDESDPNQHKLTADPNTGIEGARIIYDPSEPVKPRFGPSNELPALTGANAVGMPVALEPPTIFNSPVTLFIPCPGVTDLSSLVVYYYNPAVGWIPADQADGWKVSGSRRDHPGMVPPVIEIQVNHFSGVQAGTPGSGYVAPAGGGGCFVDNASF